MRLRTWFEIARPFSLTASIVPILVGSAFAWQQGLFTWWLFLLTLTGAVLAQVGTNIVNEVYDVAKGVDREDTPRASRVILERRLSSREALAGAALVFGAGFAIGIVLTLVRGWPILALTLVGGAMGYLYTGPPFAYKYHALGVPLVFVLMGPLMVVGAYYVQAGSFSWEAIWVSIPVGLLVAAILHANELRDIESDREGEMVSVAMLIGREWAAYLYTGMLVLAYAAIATLLAAQVVQPWVLLTFATAFVAWRGIRTVISQRRSPDQALAMIDVQTAQLHLLFGLALTLSLFLSGL